MPNLPFFSVIIPTYNRAEFLPTAIESVLAQSYENWELIIVDDGSIDETSEVVEKYLPDRRIKYYWQENKELNGARNSGIKLASGDYITFLDDDDSYLPNHLTIIARFIGKHKGPTAIFKTDMLIPDGKKDTKGDLINTSTKIQSFWFSPTNLLSFAFPRMLFQDLIFEEEFLLAEDFHFLITALIWYPVVQIHEATVVYTLQPESRSLKYFSEEYAANKIAAISSIWEKHQPHLSQHLPKHAYSWKINREYLHFARLAFRADQKKTGWKYFYKALKKPSSKLLNIYLRTFVLGAFGI